MGNTLRREFLNTWGDSDVQEWKVRARRIIGELWRSFCKRNGQNWSVLTYEDRLAIVDDALEQSAIPIDNNDGDIRRKIAKKILDQIFAVWNSATEGVGDFSVDMIFVHCKEGRTEYSLPIFKLQWYPDGRQDVVRFIDHTCRVYNDWNHWMYSNKYPMMKYCYPTNGDYDDENPLFKFGTSPICDTDARTFRVLDVLVSTGNFAAGVVITLGLVGPADFITAPVLHANDKIGLICTMYGYYW